MSVETAKRTRTRMRKVECEDCATILYGSAAALRGGLPTCACGGAFVVPNLADLELIDPDAFERVVDSLGEREHNGLMRVLGYDHAIALAAAILHELAEDGLDGGDIRAPSSALKHVRAARAALNKTDY